MAPCEGIREKGEMPRLGARVGDGGGDLALGRVSKWGPAQGPEQESPPAWTAGLWQDDGVTARQTPPGAASRTGGLPAARIPDGHGRSAEWISRC